MGVKRSKSSAKTYQAKNLYCLPLQESGWKYRQRLQIIDLTLHDQDLFKLHTLELQALISIAGDDLHPHRRIDDLQSSVLHAFSLWGLGR